MGRAGNAGMIATFAIAFAGVVIGAVAAYVSEYGAAARASKTAAMTAALRENAGTARLWRERDAIVERVLAGENLERLPRPAPLIAPMRPKIIIIFDDMGLDRRALERVSRLPGPVTLSFLPYARNVDKRAETVRARGVETMLHLPMEPAGDEDPGPHALRSDMTGAKFIKELEWNLGRMTGFVGVNNHMGSKLTADEAAMKTLLAYLKQEGLFFIDSVTTGDTVARQAGAMVGAKVFSRDVFLDAEAETAEEIKNRLRQVERIARETGFAVAICHPYEETLDIIGPWLTSAPYRGFDLVAASALIDIERRLSQPLVADAQAAKL